MLNFIIVIIALHIGGCTIGNTYCMEQSKGGKANTPASSGNSRDI